MSLRENSSRPAGACDACPSWRPIATAPRDGTTILIRFGKDGVSQGRYVGGETGYPWEFTETGNAGSYINHACDGQYGPSQWMPMPGASGGAGTLASGDLSDEYLARISYSAFGIVCEDHEAVAFARFVIAQDRQQRAADTRIAELEQALKGAAIIADTAGAEIRALRERIAALSATRTLKPVAWENPSTFAILREESPDMCDRRRKVWRPLAYAGPLDAHRGRIANRAGLVSRVLEPENDWGLMSDTPLQVEFGAYKSKPKAFTCSYEYRPDEDITEAVTCWMPLPVGPVIKREQDSPEGGQS